MEWWEHKMKDANPQGSIDEHKQVWNEALDRAKDIVRMHVYDDVNLQNIHNHIEEFKE
jgi:hypothetical protein